VTSPVDPSSVASPLDPSPAASPVGASLGASLGGAASPPSGGQLRRHIRKPLPQSDRFPPQPVMSQIASGAHWMPQSAEPEHAIVQSPWQAKSQLELPAQDPVEFGPSAMLQSEELGQVALQLALHCIVQLD
jgi:hypothetical protein